MRFIPRFLRPAKPPATTLALDAIIAQARQPVFYIHFQVPDTTEGRFEVLMLHLFIALHALRAHPEAATFQQQLFDAAFQQLDWNLREIGVGDMTVGKKIQRMAEIFYGRVTQYSAALAGGEALLAGVLGETLYPATATPAAAVLAELARYVASAVAGISADAAASVASGQILFPPAAEQPLPSCAEVP